MLLHLLALSLPVWPGPAPGPARAVAASPTAPALGDDFEALLGEYERARKDHEAELRRLKGAERRERAQRGPVRDFWPRFETLADGGEGRALFWMAANAGASSDSTLAGQERKRELYGELVEHHAAEGWFADVVRQLPSERSQLGPDEVLRLCRQALAKSPAREVQALCLEALVSELKKQRSPEAREEAELLLERLATDYADTDVGARAARLRQLQVGAVAPDFTGKTIDGYEFKLSDYRGKVVLIDFYGFW